MIAKVITNIAQVVHLAEEHCRGDWLYRGQSTTNPPIPKAFRPATIRSIDVGAIKCGFEAMVGHEFRDYAHSVHSSCPEDKSWYEWLALMQHYGAATRLLDWSRSLLAAAFFAVEHSDKNDAYDGEIWVLNSGALTEFTRIAHDPKQTTNFSCSCLDGARGSPGIEFSINKAVDRLAEQAFADDRFRKEKECRFQHTCRYPLASAPPRKFARLAAQRGWFTIHPVTPDVPLPVPPGDFHRADQVPLVLTHILDGHGVPVLQTYRVPNTSKRAIRDTLDALGISRATLFADLDGLSASLLPSLMRRYPLASKKP